MQATITEQRKRCLVYVSPREGSEGGFDHERCVECGTSWRHHRNIGPGWRSRSEARKVQLDMYPNIVLGEE